MTQSVASWLNNLSTNNFVTVVGGPQIWSKRQEKAVLQKKKCSTERKSSDLSPIFPLEYAYNPASVQLMIGVCVQ